MSSAQKVIKYLAIAFAIFLIVSIFSAIASGIGLIESNGSGSNKTTTSSINHDRYDSYIDINLKYTNLKIVQSETLKVDNNNDNIKVEINNNKLLITDSSNWFTNDKNNRDLTVYVPTYVMFDIVNINTGAGKVVVEGFNTKDLTMNLGAGEVLISNIVSDKNKIDTGTGSVSIKDSKLNDVKFDLGIGKISIDADITGDSSINSGIGEVDLRLTGSREDYSFDVNKGIGSISLNGDSLSDGAKVGSGRNNIKLNGGIGAISIKTN